MGFRICTHENVVIGSMNEVLLVEFLYAFHVFPSYNKQSFPFHSFASFVGIISPPVFQDFKGIAG